MNSNRFEVVASAMSFIMMDGQSHALLDIVENRRLPYLERYFSRFFIGDS